MTIQSFRVGPETARLYHRAFTIDDAESVFALNSDPEVMRYTGEPMMESLEMARQLIENYPDFETVGYGRWACVLKETSEVIGFCGLKFLTDLQTVDVGYRLLPKYWGQGLATEACIGSLEFGFQVIGLDQIIGLVEPANQRSVRVLEKSGMKFEKEFSYDEILVRKYVKDRPSSVDSCLE